MNSVQSLQHMLNHLARTVPSLPRLAESGVFDEATLEAVMVFQRDFGLPVTGIVDQITWDIIKASYYQNLFQHGTPPLLHVFPVGSGGIRENEQAAEVVITQAMLSELSKIFSTFVPVEQNGINNGTTFKNLKQIQALALIENNGTLNRATWVVLAALYRAFVMRRALGTTPL